MSDKKILILPGDGIGHEITKAAQFVLDKVIALIISVSR